MIVYLQVIVHITGKVEQDEQVAIREFRAKRQDTKQNQFYMLLLSLFLTQVFF